jgi:hypothetical protein
LRGGRFIGQELHVVRVEDGATVRVVPLSDGDSFQGEVVATGWATDSARFLAVLRFGYGQHDALLSFGIATKDDYWERLLGEDVERYGPGFLVSPRSVSTRR